MNHNFFFAKMFSETNFLYTFLSFDVGIRRKICSQKLCNAACVARGVS